MRYIVVRVTTEPADPEGMFDGSIDEEDAWIPDVKGLALCEDVGGVCAAVKLAEDSGCEWAIFEVADGGAHRRALVRPGYPDARIE